MTSKPKAARPDVYCSNFRVSVESFGKTHFAETMRMCFDAHRIATHYVVDEKGLHLFWAPHEKAAPLPYEMAADEAIGFAWGWLKKADRGPEPGLDGSVEPTGFVVETPRGGWWQAIATIRAVWTEFHK